MHKSASHIGLHTTESQTTNYWYKCNVLYLRCNKITPWGKSFIEIKQIAKGWPFQEWLTQLITSTLLALRFYVLRGRNIVFGKQKLSLSSQDSNALPYIHERIATRINTKIMIYDISWTIETTLEIGEYEVDYKVLESAEGQFKAAKVKLNVT